MMVKKYSLGEHVLLDGLDKRAVMSVVLEFFLVPLPILETNIIIHVCIIILEPEIIYKLLTLSYAFRYVQW